MIKIICEFCKQEINKNYLKRHLQTTKKCLAIQFQSGSFTEKKVYNCRVCNKEFTTSYRKGTHESKCSETFAYSQHTTNFVAENQNITIINIVNNYPTVTEYINKDSIQDILIDEDVRQAASTEDKTAEYIVDNLLTGKGKPLYLCSDKDRKTFVMYGKDNKKIRDKNSNILSSIIKTQGYSCSETPILMKGAVNNLLGNVGTEKYVKKLASSLPSSVDERVLLDELREHEKQVKNNTLERNRKLTELAELSDMTREKIEARRNHFVLTGNLNCPREMEGNRMLMDKLQEYCLLP